MKETTSKNDVPEHPFESPGGQNEVLEHPFQSQGGQGGREPETDEGDRVFGPSRRRLRGAILFQNPSKCHRKFIEKSVTEKYRK